MADIEQELGLFFPWGCVYPVAQYAENPVGEKWQRDYHPKTGD